MKYRRVDTFVKYIQIIFFLIFDTLYRDNPIVYKNFLRYNSSNGTIGGINLISGLMVAVRAQLVYADLLRSIPRYLTRDCCYICVNRPAYGPQ